MISITDLVSGLPYTGTATTRNTTGAGSWIVSRSSPTLGVELTPQFAWIANVTGTGTVTATINLEGTQDPTGGIGRVVLATITLSGTTTAFDGAALMAPWTYVRYNITALTGTGAVVSVLQGVGN